MRSFPKMIETLDTINVEAHRKCKYPEDGDLDCELNGKLNECIHLLSRMHDRAKKRRWKFRPGMRVRCKSIGTVNKFVGTLNDHMELPRDGFARATMVFDGQGRLVGYEKSGCLLREVKG